MASSFTNSGGYTEEGNSLGTEILGTQLLDLYSSDRPETASIGNSNSDCFIRFYDSDIPSRGYFLGTSNNNFYLNKASNIFDTKVGIGTKSPNANLHVQGKVLLSALDSYNSDNRLNFSTKTLSSISNVELFGEVIQRGVPMRSSPWIVNDDGSVYIRSDSPSNLTSNVGIGTTMPLYDLHVHGNAGFTTITTADPTTSNINFDRKSLTNVQNLQFFGNLFSGESIFKTTQWLDDPQKNVYFPDNVGIGTTTPSDKLHVIGDLRVTGDIFAREFSHIDRVDGLFELYNIYAPNQPNNMKRVYTNDSNIMNRVLYTFEVQSGRYFVTGNLPFKNLTPFVALPNFNWARIELYSGTPASISRTSQPMTYVPITITTDATEIVTQPYTLLIESMAPGPYTVVVSGKGHNLEFGSSNNSPSSKAYLMPIRGLGQETSYNGKFTMQSSPLRKSYSNIVSSNFSLSTPGRYYGNTSNADVFIDGQKLQFNTNYTMAYIYDTELNQTSFTVNLTSPTAANNKIEVTVWPVVEAETLYESGFYYQNNRNFTSQWLNLENGNGIRYAGGKVIIDGDIHLSGQVYSACNVGLFSSGHSVNYIPLLHIESNVVGTLNIVDSSITTEKIRDENVITVKLGDLAVTTAKINNLAVTNDKYAMNSISDNKMQVDSVSTSRIQDLAITTPKHGNFSVTNIKVGPKAITEDKLDFSLGCNIGFGTTNPRVTLDIFGSTIINDRSKPQFTTQAPRATLDVIGNAIFNNGNVGIGSVIPMNTLDVNGGLRINDFMNITNGSSGIRNTGRNNATIIANDDHYGNFKIFNNANSGYNGIYFSDSLVSVVANSTECGFHKKNDGWRLQMTDNDLYIRGNITGFYSDERLKTDLQKIEDADDVLKQLTGYRFRWNDVGKRLIGNELVENVEVGLIAQDVQRACPQAVRVNKASPSDMDYLTINYDKLIPFMIESIKKQQKRIEILELEVSRLALISKDVTMNAK